MKTTIENLFYAIVDQYPDKTAIEYGEKTITYRNLDRRSNAIANYILQQGLKKDTKVGILLNDRIEIISTMIGVLKAGAVFVPFDTSFPTQRLANLVEVVDFDLFFADEASLALAEELFATESTGKPEMIHHAELETIWQDGTYHHRPVVEQNPDDPVYIYFTSGSTGKPKGILGRYKGLVHFIQWEIDTFQINEAFRTSQFVTPSFDAFLRDTFVPLCAGGTLCIPQEKEVMLSADRLIRWIETARVNLIHCVPSVFRLLLTGELAQENFLALQYILLSGERVNPKDLRLWYGIFGERIQLVNLYGPSETTMVKTFYPIKEEDQQKASIPIGQPMRGCRVLVLDEAMKPCPVAMVGEIYIRTPYMTLGYYNAPELTRDKFVPNPYSSDPNDLLYRTGDLGRVLADGNLELIGRKDYQVKIRGVRVELGDIENQILAHPAVKEAVVVDREGGDGERYLVAYLVTREAIPSAEIRTFLSERLPEAMLPGMILFLEAMPLTPNGKIDRKALPEPDWRLNSGVEYVAPRNSIEEELCAIWSELLGMEQIGIQDHFFELGGHSLKATRLESRIQQQWNVEVPLKVIFAKPTIAELAEYIQTGQQQEALHIPVVEKRDYYPASFAQKRLFVLNQFTGPNLGYNMPRVYHLTGRLEYHRLEEALQELIQRQESLRTSFKVVDGEPVQVIHDQVEFAVEYAREEEENQRETERQNVLRADSGVLAETELSQMIQKFIRPFEFADAPLFRVGIVRLADEKHLLLFDMHHIISDQISMGVFMEEFLSLYEGKALAPLQVQYKDYSVWQHELVKAGTIALQEEFWLQTLRNDLPVLTLPTDYQRPAIKGTAGDVYNFALDADQTATLNALAAVHGVTLYMTFLAAFNLFLAKYSGQEDIVVGTPLAGRSVPALDKVIGMFVNTLPMRNQPISSLTFVEFLAKVKENTLAVFDHQEYQIDLLIDKLDLSRDMSRNPLFDVMLVLQNEIDKGDRGASEIAGLTLKPYPFELHRSKFDFILFALESNQGIFWQFEYSTELFKAETIEMMAGHWLNLLKNICLHPDWPIGRIEMVGDLERELLFGFNHLQLDYPRAKTIHQLFEEQVQKTPEQIAVRFEGTLLTYAELNRRANRLARFLRKRGVGADVNTESVVGLMLKRSPDMIVSLLAILKAGGAYLPIDPDYPLERVLYMLEDAGAKVLLTESGIIRGLPFTSLENFAAVDGSEIVFTGIRSHIKEFNQLPMPDRSLIDLSKYKNQIGMASIANCISLQTSRGCPYHCLYCHKVWSKSHVFRSAENIYQEVEFYYRSGVRNFAILDDCFNLNRENSERFFKLVIRNGLKVKIFFPNGLRGDLLTRDYIDLMVEAGTVNINLSLETASPRLQKAVKKYLNIDTFRDVMEYIATQHPSVILELATMLGFPTETEEEALQTLQFIQSIHWIHFPYIHVLKVFPNTEMEEFALANGVQKEAILRSVGLAYHELPETLPFSKNFARQYQQRFLNEYFLNPERLRSVLPVQMQNIDPGALIQKYNAYLPIEVTKLEDVLDFAGISDFTLPDCSVQVEVPEIFASTPGGTRAVPAPGAKKILFLDLSQHFRSHDMLYNVAEQPLGLLYLLTYLKEQFGAALDGRIYKAGNDFDSYQELKAIVDEYQPDLIGIRTLSFYREFFHETVSLLRDWGVTVPIITGGPYVTSEYESILCDSNVDLAVIGEGEYTMVELVKKMLENEFALPTTEVLETIEGIAFRRSVCVQNNAERKVVLLDQIGDCLLEEDVSDLDLVNTATNLAYVMYTSGTTGRPKGIMVEHRQVNNCIFWMQNEFKLDGSAVIVQRTNLTFDPSVWEIFWPLYIGGTVKLLTAEQGKDADFLLELLTDETEQLTMMYCPASLVTGMVYLLNSRGKDLTLKMPWFLIGAEPIRSDVVKQLYQYLQGTIVNTYGPTECTINNTYCYLEPNREDGVIPIGRPVANNQLYILSRDLQLLPMGMVGEICISGESVARGYIHNPEKTAENFVPNPFGTGRLYKTGDLGRWLPNGMIEILGRVDDQVKVRGYRIEPGEIETALLQHPDVREAVVIVKDPKEKRKNVKICKFCGVTSVYPGITIQQDGVCNLCEEFSQYEKITTQYFKTPEDLYGLIRERSGEQYDLLLLYAGGRASAYALYQLVDQGFKVLTATYDNGYFSAQDKARIQQITDRLGVEHIWLTHPNTDLILAESLKHAHTVCNGCFFASSSLAVQYAVEHGIKTVVGATLSRGQIIENKLYKLMKQGISDVQMIENELSNLQRNTPDMNRHIFDLLQIQTIDDGSVYDLVKVVDFYRYFDITNKDMIANLNERDAYWVKRKNYAIYSTNCAIKQIGDFCHLTDLGYHYYGAATSWEKRLGHITMENVQEDLQCQVGAAAFANFSRLIHYEKPRAAEKMDAKYLCAYIVAEEELSFAAMREYLLKDLPEYMIPSAFVQLGKLPLTSNGKIDRHALPEPEALVQTNNAYVSPRSEQESGIAAVWAEVLGVAKVGIRDNFIELGGDSIKAIQLASRMNSAGFEVKIRDIFTYQTIEELVPHLCAAETMEIHQGLAEGALPLTGIQRWFFAGNPVEPYHYNQSVLFALNPEVNLSALEKAFNVLIRHHDTLRLNYRRVDAEHPWGELFYNEVGLESDVVFEYFDFSQSSPEEQDQQMEFWGSILKAGFRLEHSLLWKVAVFDLGRRGKRLLITIHHLLVDGISWRILLADLFQLYQQIAGGMEVKLPTKTHSFKDWAEGIVRYSMSTELAEEIPHWQGALEKMYTLPTDFREPSKAPELLEDSAQHSAARVSGDVATSVDSVQDLATIATEDVVTGELSHTVTQRLLTRCNSAYNTEINDLLLTALARTVTNWTGRDHVVITLEGHGREEIIPGLDISRTVGWFTSMYPVNLDLSGCVGIGAEIKNIKEQMRSIPQKGVGYLILKYLTNAPELQGHPDTAGIIFNYLGQFDGETNAELIQAASESTGSDSSPQRKRRALLEFSGLVTNGQLRLSITYSTTNYAKETMQNLINSYVRNLQTVVEHCLNTGGDYTPSDFPLAVLSQDYLNRVDKGMIEDIYALSPLQEGMLYHYLYDQNAANYFEQSIFTLEGDLHLTHLEEAWNFTIRQNEVLRTVFHWKELQKPVQLVYAEQPCKLRVHNLRDLCAAESEAVVAQLRAEDQAQQFDLEHGPVMRITVCDLGQNRYQIIMSYHHILFDGWCLGLIFTEIFTTYLLLQQGKRWVEIEQNYRQKTRYREYIGWLKSRDLRKAEEFWRGYLQEFSEPTTIPTDQYRSGVVKIVESVTWTASTELTRKLEALTREQKVTPNILLQAVWGLLLQRYNNTHDVVIGAVVSGRPAEIPGIEEMIGLFINAIPVRIRCDSNMSAVSILRQLQEESVIRQEYEYASLPWIKEQSELRGTKTPLFDHLFIFENYPVSQSVGTVNPGFSVTGYEAFELTNYDLNLEALYVGDQLEVRFGYNIDCYQRATIARLAEHYENLLNDLVQNPLKSISRLELLSSAEKDLLLHTFNDTAVDYPTDRLVHQLIGEQVTLHPSKIAVVYEDQQLTFAEYNAQANLLAKVLLEKGIRSEEIVGVLVDPSLEMMIAVFAVLKAGGAFLPIDPRYPDGRIEFMLSDAQCKVLLTQRHLVDRTNWPCETLIIDEEIQETEVARSDDRAGSLINVQDLPSVAHPGNLAYVIYTSGSTGLPKGVMIEHRALSNLTHWYTTFFQITAEDICTRYAGFSFDASVSEMFPALCRGAEVHVIPERLRLDLTALNAYFEEKGITIAFLPTVMAEQFLNLENHSLRILDTGGDKLKAYAKTPYIFIDSYGPTENTVITTSFIIDQDYVNSPIGKPIFNNRVYILDQQDNLLPLGVPGELCISGASLARGYLNDVTLTTERFVPNPFEPGERMYRTGDLARWLPDGNLEFLGRADFQVKIRGFRIDLGEIETLIRQNESVKEAVVIAREDQSGQKDLVAYLCAENKLLMQDLREFLGKRLPDYMIPVYFIQLEEFPLTVNGKIDHRALPEPDGSQNRGTEYVPPTGLVEETLTQIWSDVLDVLQVGVCDNFFTLGGHSLKATTVVARIYKELGVELPISQIFASPTIRELAETIIKLGRTSSSEAGLETQKSASITRVQEREYYPVSSAQKRMFVLYHMEAANTQYNIPTAFYLEGSLDLERFEQTFCALIHRHESLRTSFAVVDGEYVQHIHEHVDFTVKICQASESELPTLMANLIRPFDLARAPLFRVSLVELANRYLVAIDMHHIISDGVSVEILIREFVALYTGQELPELKVRFRDFAVWESEFLRSAQIKAQEAYWLGVFSGEIPVLVLPTDFPRPVMLDIAGNTIAFAVDQQTTMKLRELANAQSVTMYMVLLSIFNILLAKYSGQEDIVVGSPIAGRMHPDLEGVIGMFVNTLVMRNAPEGGKTFETFLSEVGANALQAYENQGYQFEMLVETLNLERDLSRNPLFDVLFALQNQVSPLVCRPDNEPIEGLKLSSYDFEHGVAKFDLSLNAYETLEGLNVSFEYKTSLFKRETILRFIRHFVNLVEAIVVDPHQKIGNYRLLSAEEEEQLLYTFNATQREYAEDLTLVHLFEKQVEQTPEAIALISGDDSRTYRELHTHVTELAKVLLAKGLGSNQIAAIMVQRSFEMAVGLLAILKAGGAYLPMDPAYPDERIQFILHDSNALIFLTQSQYLERVNFKGETILFDKGYDCADQAFASPCDVIHPDDLAYVIYTSGTTGLPKGVMVEHRNISNTIQWAKEEYRLAPATKVLGVLSYAFDAFGIAFYSTLASGAQFVIMTDDEIKDPLAIKRQIKMQQVHHLSAAPSIYASLLECLTPDDMASLRTVQLGGEKLTVRHVEKSKELNALTEIVNEYGPTENSILTTIQRNVTPDQSITIGKPIANCQVYIIDRYGQLVPAGVIGEICVSGRGLARGYLNRPELTANKFTMNPHTGERMYHTGDLGRWLPDGRIDFIGRMDHQVKIRGYRIELGEIESRMLKDPRIIEAVVIDREDHSGTTYLTAYYVAESEISALEWKDILSEYLPQYMVPAYYLRLEQIPLTVNGKVDHSALPVPDLSLQTESTGFAAPRTEVEEKLAKIWTEVLGLKQVGINHNFFDLGGHSLKATSVSAKIYKTFHVEVRLRDLFRYPTIKKLAEHIATLEASTFKTIEYAERSEYYPVSSAQRRLLILDQFEGIGLTYNMPGALWIEGKLDQDRLEDVLNKLIARHEILRTSFANINGELVQQVHTSVDFHLERLQSSWLDKDLQRWRETMESQQSSEAVLKSLEAMEFFRRFDLSHAPLFRVGLAELEVEKYLLLYDLHHTVADGLTMQILIHDLIKLYVGEELPELRMQYKDFAVWQKNLITSGKMQKQEAYWLSQFEDGVPALNLPTDYPRPAVMSFEGETYKFVIGEVTSALNELASREGVTLYMVLLAAFNMLLARYSGQEDIVIGAPVAGRTHADLTGVAGLFINTLALRNAPVDAKTYQEFLHEVAENTITAFENQDYQFEQLIDQLKLERDLSRNPLFDVSFIVQNFSGDSAVSGDESLHFTSVPIQNQTAKFDLLLNAAEQDEEIAIKFEYSTKLFRRESIERMAAHYSRILHAIASNPTLPLGAISMLSSEEKVLILQGFNNTAHDLPEDKLVHQLIEETVNRYGDRRAVVFGEQELTYQMLNERANRIARILRQKGVGSGVVVGIMLEPCLDLITGLFGILKANGAFLPIDPAYPVGRVEYMMSDSQSTVLITQAHLAEKLEHSGVVIILEEVFRAMEAGTLTVMNQLNADETTCTDLPTSQSLAYIIYTSGSTGKPKGVMIEHRALINMAWWFMDYYELTPDDRGTKYAGFGFDASVLEIFPFLLKGAEIHIVSDELRLNLTRLNSYFEENQITLSFLPTQVAEKFIQLDNDSLRCLITGGDKLKQYVKTRYRLVNNYGPTENTVISTAFEVEQIYNNIPIGKPIYNNRVYILDQNGNLQPVGVPGELCVAGSSLARGYLHQSVLTEEKFVPDPFVPGERMYRSGDLARWLPDGNLEFLGRIDQQVKIRGFRIELGEIETHLLLNKRIHEATVIDWQDGDGNAELVAYYVADEEIPTAEWKAILAISLPVYMIPGQFIRLTALPLTANGKVNRKALPKPDSVLSAVYVAPTNELEWKLAHMWSTLLGSERVGIQDNFFELGGHSLKAADLITLIYRDFGVEISLREIFTNPTIHGLAQVIGQAEVTNFTTIPIVAKREFYPVSSAQRRLFILHQLKEHNISYNIPNATLIQGELDPDRLEAIFQTLVDRHESFRTTFDFVEGEPVQRIHGNIKFRVEKYIPGREDTGEVLHSSQRGSVLKVDSPAVQKIVQNFVRPFDLSQTPLLRVALIDLGDQYLLLMDMHHIIADGTAMAILLDEIVQLYKGRTLPALSIQYKDFALWQNQLFTSSKIRAQEKYWVQQFAGEIPVLELPTDYPRPGVMTYEGATIQFSAGEELTKRLNQFIGQRGGSMYMLLLTALNVLLTKYSGQDDIVIGSPIAGRSHADLARIVGMFVNTLAMRNQPQAQKTVGQFFAEVRETALNGYDNQDYQFEMLIEKLELQRDLNRNPLFDVMLVLQNFSTGKEGFSDLKFTQYNFDLPVTKFDLLLNANETAEGLRFTLQYWIRIFKPETIERMMQHFLRILEVIVDHPEQTIGALDMLTVQERERVLKEFNSTIADYPRNITVHQLVEAQVMRTPDDIALTFRDRHLTYREMNAKANVLARWLRGRGAGPDRIIGLRVERSPEMVIGILAILKAGSAYLPIDPDYPEERINYMLAESGTQIVLLGKDIESALEVVGEDDTNLTNLAAPENLVYVIYTSGSTGKPKGVMIEHQNVCNLLQFEHTATEVNYRSKVLQFASISFDVSFQEIFSTLTAGGELYLVQQDLRNNIPQLLQYIADEEIEILFLPAALVKFIFSENEFVYRLPKCIKEIIVAGEQLVVSQGLREYLAVNGVRLHNHYGPSETHVVTTLTMRPDEWIPDLPAIGRPISNTQIYILDQTGLPQPIGIPGELWIAGCNVGRGYINRPDLTEGKFVENPFNPGERMYRTGDIARWMEDGTIEFRGRMDQQVKIRGYRIEPGEIESKLLDHPLISEAVVIDYTDAKGNKDLAAYIVMEQVEDRHLQVTTDELREHLLKNLPEYMIPAYFVQLDRLPLTSNGKVNRHALPEVDEHSRVITGNYAPPTSAIEKRLASIWSDILGIEQVGIHDNFFTLGGHSLKATSMVAKIYKEFGIELPLREMFRTPTIHGLATYISSADTGGNLRKIEDESLVLLRRGSDEAKNLFLVHDGTGDVGGYLALCNHLKADFNCWGIQMDWRESCAVENLKIPVIAQQYVDKIRTIDPVGPYYLMGWSLGGSIAFEMARQLEADRIRVAFLALIDSMAPRKEFLKSTKEFTVQSEWKWIRAQFPGLVESSGLYDESAATWQLTREKGSTSSLEDLWQTVEAAFSASESGAQIIRDALHDNLRAAIPGVDEATVKDLLYYVNRIRSLNRAHAAYVPASNLHTPLVYFKAKETEKGSTKHWSRFCAGEMRVHEINGNHFTMMRSEGVAEIVQVITEMVKESLK